MAQSDDSVKVYVYYDIPLQRISYLYFVGGHCLLLSLSGPLDLPYSVEQWSNKSDENTRYLL